MAVVWIIDDSDLMKESLIEIVADIAPDAVVKTFDMLRDAHLQPFGPDVCIVDISAVCGIGQSYMTGNFLWPFVSKFPGADVIVLSAIGKQYEPAIRRCFDDNKIPTGRLFVCSGGCSMFPDLEGKLRECLITEKEPTE